MIAEADQKNGVNKALVFITALLAILSALEYWAIITWDGVTNQTKISAILTVIGAYGISIGFFGRMKDLGSHIHKMIGELISPNAGYFLAANFTYLGIVCSTLAIGLNSRKSKYPPAILYLLSSLVLLLIALVIFTYVFFHLVIVIPLTYPAVFIASLVVEAFENATTDNVLTVTDKDAEQAMKAHVSDKPDAEIPKTATRISLKQFVLRDKVAATGFIMGLPAAVLAMIGKIVLPFL